MVLVTDMKNVNTLQRKGEAPFVSVVTPVYNGEKYLRECIESVLGQSFQNWEFIILNNCSTDGTWEIITEYSQRDPRIKPYNNANFLKQVENFNAALGKISNESVFTQVLMADDWLFRDCLAQKVEVALANPTVGLVGSYRLVGKQVRGDNLPYPSTITAGAEIGRSYLQDSFHIGTVTSVLIRTELVREKESFFDETALSCDRLAYLDILAKMDFGFVHQVLTFDRKHEESTRALVNGLYKVTNTERLNALLVHGRRFLTAEEFDTEVARSRSACYRLLARLSLTIGAGGARRYNAKRLRQLFGRVNGFHLMAAFVRELADVRGILIRNARGVRSWSMGISHRSAGLRFVETVRGEK